MRAWFSQHMSALRDTLRRLARSPLATLLNLGVIALALSLPAVLYLALSQLQGLSRQFAADPQLSLFLALDATTTEVQSIADRLQERPGVGEVRFVPRAEALAELRRNSGLDDVLITLKDNPLPDAFIVTVQGNRPEALEALRDEAAGWPKVEHAQLDSVWARRLNAALRISRTLVLLLGALLAGGLVAVIFNTIRLQILTRRDEIEVSRLIGATNAFIRRPFLYFGVLQGLAGGALALALIATAVCWVNQNLADLTEFAQGGFRLNSLPAAESLALVGLSSLLGGAGAWLSVSRHLWRTRHA